MNKEYIVGVRSFRSSSKNAVVTIFWGVRGEWFLEGKV